MLIWWGSGDNQSTKEYMCVIKLHPLRLFMEYTKISGAPVSVFNYLQDTADEQSTVWGVFKQPRHIKFHNSGQIQTELSHGFNILWDLMVRRIEACYRLTKAQAAICITSAVSPGFEQVFTFFQQKYEYAFTSFIIPPHKYDRVNRNPSSYRTGTCQVYHGWWWPGDARSQGTKKTWYWPRWTEITRTHTLNFVNRNLSHCAV